MATSWIEVLLIVVTYCGLHTPAKESVDSCRVVRMGCVKRGALMLPGTSAEDLIGTCLSNPSADFKIETKLNPKKPEAKAQK